jgi:DNA-binding NarL/FixJ family response regulator
MPQAQNNENKKKEESLFKKPPGILVDEKYWLFLRDRYHMTPRELQVAILVCRGFNNDEIAEGLKIRHGTVKTHLRNLYRKAWVESKMLLLLKFVEDVNQHFASQQTGKSPIPISQIPPKTEATETSDLKK